MDSHWWQLPGPGRFVESVVADFRSGRNVLLRFPTRADRGFRQAVAAQVRANDLWRWRLLDASTIDAQSLGELVTTLFVRLGCAPGPGQLPNPSALAAAVRDGDVMWVDNLDAERWPLWYGFLRQFQHACHAREETRRGLFCLPLIGGLSVEPDQDTALGIHRWSDSLSRLDVMLYLDRMISCTFSSRTLRQVALAVATELAGADAQLGVRLAAEGVQLLDDYTRILKVHAQDRGWSAELIERPQWCHGVLEMLDGEERLNSAAIAAGGDLEAIERRVWQGQIRVLYPFIEERRVRLVQQVSRLIQLPIETTYGKVDRVIDLEIGQLVYFLDRRRVPDLTWRQLNLLRKMRHRLAHLRHVDVQDLMSTEFSTLDQPQ